MLPVHVELPDGKRLNLDVHDSHLGHESGQLPSFQRRKQLCVTTVARVNQFTYGCSGVAEQFFFSPLSLEPLGGEWPIDFEEGVHQRLWQSIMACSIDVRPVSGHMRGLSRWHFPDTSPQLLWRFTAFAEECVVGGRQYDD